MGKSALVMNIATNVAKNSKIPVLVFNLEMGKDQLTDRIICSEALINSRKYRNGIVDENDLIHMVDVMDDLAETEIYIDDNSKITISQISSICRKMKIEKNIGLVIIDYLQLITPSSGKNSREQEVADISRSLKILAKDLDIPVIALSQLSRANEKRSGKNETRRPMLSDLRDSGSIEQDADMVIFIHREDYYNPSTEKQKIAEVIFAKHRSGEPRNRRIALVE